MTRRRLILAACVAVVALGAAWWLLGHRLTTEEQRLVGSWRLNGPEGQGPIAFELFANGEFAEPQPDGRLDPAYPRGRWKAADGWLMVDYEQSQWRRLARPLASTFGFSVQPLEKVQTHVEGNSLKMTSKSGKTTAWTRDRGD